MRCNVILEPFKDRESALANLDSDSSIYRIMTEFKHKKACTSSSHQDPGPSEDVHLHGAAYPN